MNFDLISLLRKANDDEKKLAASINSAFKSVKVVGRGTLIIDPEDIFSHEKFTRDLDRAKRLINKYK